MMAYEALDLLASSCALVGADGRLLFANAALEQTLHLSRKTLQAKRLYLHEFLTQPELLQQGITQIQTHKASVWSCEVGLRVPERTVLQHMVLSEGAESGSFVVELVDVSRIDQSERELRSSQQNASSRELIRNLAHEIKNPLGGIRGAAQLLQVELEGQWDDYLQVIVGETDRLQSLVDQLLLPHRQQFLPLALNVHEVCEYVRRVTLAQYGAGVRITRDYDLSLPDIFGDREQLIQAVLNIVQNAAQMCAAQAANEPAHIVIKTRARHQCTFGGRRHRLAIGVQIFDNGPGIAPDWLEKIFFPLVSGREGGSGLGLPLAQTFILQHGGHIEASNRSDGQKGAVFTILLPVQDAAHSQNGA